MEYLVPLYVYFIAELDYKAIVSGTHDFLELLTPVLTSSNVHILAKLNQQFSKCSKQIIEPSNIYRVWITKLFTDQGSKARQFPYQEWISRYNLCKEYFDKLQTEDLVLFIQDTIFTDEALDNIPRSIREDLLKRTLKYATLQLQQSKEISR